MRPNDIAAKRSALVNALFIREGDPTYLSTEGTPARIRYRLRPEADKTIAAATWADHGVCLACNLKAIAAGRCLNCGTTYETPAAFPTPSLALDYGAIAKTAARRLAGGV